MKEKTDLDGGDILKMSLTTSCRVEVVGNAVHIVLECTNEHARTCVFSSMQGQIDRKKRYLEVPNVGAISGPQDVEETDRAFESFMAAGRAQLQALNDLIEDINEEKLAISVSKKETLQ